MNSKYGPISDMAHVQQNRLLLCTASNFLLLIDSHQGEVLYRLLLMASPLRRVCIISKNYAAVTIEHNNANKVQYITIKDDTLELGENVRVSIRGHIMGICAMKDNLAVSYVDPSAVEMISEKGKVINRIDHDSTGREIFISLWYVTASPDYDHIFVSDHETNTITLLNPDLKLLKTFSDRNLLNSPRGLLIWNDQVLVCGETSNSIVLLDPSSGQMSNILDGNDGMEWPVALAFCRQTSTLFIILKKSIQRYQLR